MTHFNHPVNYFMATASQHPDKLAVLSNDLSFTYQELDRLSSTIASRLRQFTQEPGDRICILMPKSALYIAAILGIWKAGCAYVPMETTLPHERRNRIIDNCKPTVIITDGNQNNLSHPILALSKELTAQESLIFSPIEARPDNLAYIIYTSGTTGTPKGVMISNAALTTLIEWCNRAFADLTSQTKILNVANFSFDQSLLDIAFFLAQGKTLYVLDDPKNMVAIPYLIHKHQINLLSTVPHVLSVLANTPKLLQRFNLSSLQTIFGGGAVFPPQVAAALKTRLGAQTRIFNIYGPTEATVYCFLHRVDEPIDQTIPLPIGRPFDTTQGLILHPETNLPMPQGSTGMLALRGPQVMQGYWQMPMETAKALIPDPNGSDQRVYLTGDYACVDPNGIYHFKGRQDDTIKSAGYRIDLNDITHNLLNLPFVADAAVIAIPDTLLENQIKAFIQLVQWQSHTSDEIIANLNNLLPYYMLPHTIEFMTALPKSPAGKTDLATLKKINQI